MISSCASAKKKQFCNRVAFFAEAQEEILYGILDAASCRGVPTSMITRAISTYLVSALHIRELFMMMRLPFESETAQRLNLDIFEMIYFAACEASLVHPGPGWTL